MVFWFMVALVVAFAVWSVFGHLRRSLDKNGCCGSCGSCSGCPWALSPLTKERKTGEAGEGGRGAWITLSAGKDAEDCSDRGDGNDA